MLRGLFARRDGRAAPDRDAAERIKALVREALALGPEDAVSASEIVCVDPTCPGTETVVLVMRPGKKTRAVKIGKAMAEVGEQDVLEALSSADGV